MHPFERFYVIYKYPVYCYAILVLHKACISEIVIPNNKFDF